MMITAINITVFLRDCLATFFDLQSLSFIAKNKNPKKMKSNGSIMIPKVFLKYKCSFPNIKEKKQSKENES